MALVQRRMLRYRNLAQALFGFQDVTLQSGLPERETAPELGLRLSGSGPHSVSKPQRLYVGP